MRNDELRRRRIKNLDIIETIHYPTLAIEILQIIAK